MLFSEITGHNKIKTLLHRAVSSNHVGHAYLIEGPEGLGKLSIAKAFSSMLVCENPSEDDACGLCPSCSKSNSENHPDISIVTNQLYDPSKKSTDILVDTIRKMKADVYIKPFMADRKIYIIPKADTMNLYAQNSLLKILEEPPEYCTIILLAENANSFLPTILSRVTALKLYPLHEQEVAGYLRKKYNDSDDEKIVLVSKMCRGSIKKAITLLENTELTELRSKLVDNLFALYDGRRKNIYDFTLFLRQNKDEIGFLMDVMTDIFRDMLCIKQGLEAEQIVNIDIRTRLIRLSDAVDSRCPLDMLSILFKYSDYFAKNIGYGIISQCLSLELWEAINDRGYRSKV